MGHAPRVRVGSDRGLTTARASPPRVGDVSQTTTGRTPVRLGRRGRTAFDLALATVIVLPSLSALSYTTPDATVFNFLETLPLFLRRRHPRLVFVVVATVMAVQSLTYDYPVWGQVAFPIALYSLARYGRPQWAWVGVAVGAVGGVVASIVWTTSLHHDTPTQYREELTFWSYLPYTLVVWTIVLAAWALGTQGRIRQAYEAELVERGRRLALEAEQRAVMAATDERARIAREMHDVVAHGLSVVIVQADGARYAAERDPAVAVRTLETIGQAGRDALAEMRRLLGLLRGSGDAELVPQPGLDDLPALLAPELEAGSVEARLDDPLPRVPDGVALTAYRVVQESLTNVRKHAGSGARAVVTVRSEPGTRTGSGSGSGSETGSEVGAGDLVVEVVDDGRGAGSPAGAGLGLIGMRERVEVHGGTLESGPVPGGGWRVRARIPT